MIALLIGILAGIITGIAPGIHINLVSSFVVLLPIAPLDLASFILGMAVTHTFLDVIPSVYLAPDAELATLPAHKMLHLGRGHEAVKLVTAGSLLCLILAVVLTPVLIYVFPRLSVALAKSMGWLLLAFVSWIILREKSFWSVFVFLTAGVLGMIVLSTQMNQPLLPLLSGLFGISGLVMNLFEKVEIPPQFITNELSPKLLVPTLSGTMAGALIALVPGLGPAQAAILIGQMPPPEMLVVAGGINTVNMVVSLVTMLTIGKARNGAMVAMLDVLKTMTIHHFLLFLSGSVLAGGIATLLALVASRVFAKFIVRINYQLLSLSILVFITALVGFLCGWFGLLILTVSTSIGIIPHLAKTNKHPGMGVILVPVILKLLT